jgi:hypothetical protein
MRKSALHYSIHSPSFPSCSPHLVTLSLIDIFQKQNDLRYIQPEALSEQVNYLYQKEVILRHCTHRDLRQSESSQEPTLAPSHRISTSQQHPHLVFTSA